MSEKRLEDYLQDLQQYAKEDAKQKKLEYEQSFKEPFVFPWTKVIIGAAILATIFWNHINAGIESLKQTDMAQRVVEMARAVKHVKVTIETDPSRAEGSDTAASTGAGVSGGVISETRGPRPVQAPPNGTLGSVDAGHSGGGSAEAPGASGAESKDDMVQVEGKWMKRSPDNIYYINGRRVLYIDQRRRQ